MNFSGIPMIWTHSVGFNNLVLHPVPQNKEASSCLYRTATEVVEWSGMENLASLYEE